MRSELSHLDILGNLILALAAPCPHKKKRGWSDLDGDDHKKTLHHFESRCCILQLVYSRVMMNDKAIHRSCTIYFPICIDGSPDEIPDSLQETSSTSLCNFGRCGFKSPNQKQLHKVPAHFFLLCLANAMLCVLT